MSCPDAAQHPGSNYYVQQVTGTIQRSSGILAKALTGLGYVGPFDWCDAKAYAASHTESAVVHSPGQVASSTFGQLFGGSSSNWLLRIAEMLLGLALVAVGVARLTRAVPAATAVARQIGAR